MNTAKEFIEKCIKYYNGFQNETVAELVTAILRYVKPSDLDKVFSELITNIPANWKPDYKAVKEAIFKSNIILLQKPGQSYKCPVCDITTYTNGGCPNCKYDEGDGDPEDYKIFWENWKEGNKKDVKSVIEKLVNKTRLEL